MAKEDVFDTASFLLHIATAILHIASAVLHIAALDLHIVRLKPMHIADVIEGFQLFSNKQTVMSCSVYLSPLSSAKKPLGSFMSIIASSLATPSTIKPLSSSHSKVFLTSSIAVLSMVR